MDTVLIVSGGKSGQTISALVSELFPEWQQLTALNLKQAKSLISQRSFDSIIINAPLPEGGTDELLAYACECTASAVLLLVPAEELDKYTKSAAVTGVAVLRKQPLVRSAFGYTLGLASAMRKRFLGLERPAVDKTDEQLRTIGRAKLALMHYLKFSEQQAHRYLEKQSMDLRIPIYEAALRIIKMYNLEARNDG